MSMAITTATATANGRWSFTTLRSALPSVGSEICTRTRVSFPLSNARVSRRTCSKPIASFSGLCPLNPLISTGSADYNGFEHNFEIVDNGYRVFAMRHGKRVPKLNRPPDQRRALLRGLTTQLLKHGRIKTTRTRASAMRKYVDKMITLAKDGSLHKRRQALGFIYEKQIVHALFAEVQDRYGERNGGYTRIIRTLPRRGDNAPMAYIELV
ncbi:50S ribosomal protein L17, chloroplastic [Cucumis sativus]|uniref:Large ribosomal subunit protein bL17c n=2 Tax=Cucumis TaxID=3655 RepID=A0A0A0L9N9_CUCSA|nr:50S ribosomal protein L17, chloroplastic [Cucumis sativus]KGN58675.1 hypothetical protein Csa_001558 [Cucumis sativus]